jgi:excisionase family DNA binding protein
MNTENKPMDTTNTIELEDAAKILGISYPHMSMLARQHKVKGEKVGKKWFIDASDIQRAKLTKLATPRPRKNKVNLLGEGVDALNQDEIEIRIKMPKAKFQMLDLALQGKDQKNLKQHLESKVEELHEKVQKHFAIASF